MPNPIYYVLERQEQGFVPVSGPHHDKESAIQAASPFRYNKPIVVNTDSMRHCYHWSKQAALKAIQERER